MAIPHTVFLFYAEMIVSENIIMYHFALPSFYKKKKKDQKKWKIKALF